MFFSQLLVAQNEKYARFILDSLCSPAFKGRGYTHHGDKNAAKFIISELKKNNIKKFNNSYTQNFYLSTNVFPNEMEVKLNEKKIIPGKDYIVNAKSKSLSGTFKIYTLNNKIIANEKKLAKIIQKAKTKAFIAVDISKLNKQNAEKIRKNIKNNTFEALGIITTEPKLTFVPSQKQENYTHIIIKKGINLEKIKKITVKITAQHHKKYLTQNIIGYIPGKVDTFIAITAHYDHLGTMGKNTFFPGAHDNASGCAMTLDIARDFAKANTKLHYGIVFMLFSGEELGLIGSKYYTENPIFPLTKIKFLLNLDLMGTGDEGIQIVNSTIFTKEYEIINKLNKKYKLLPTVKKRGPAANSDHYFFYKKGIPAFFVYSLGKYKEYHNIHDNRENIPLNAYNQMYKLFKYFIIELNTTKTKK